MNIDLDLQKHSDKLQVIDKGGTSYFFDSIRKKYIQILPEEMVRQLFIHFLVHDCHYPVSRIQVEKALLINGMTRRFDIVIYDWEVKPFLIVECKSFKIDLNQNAADQVSRYNMVLGAPYMAITNGLKTYCTHFTGNDVPFFMNKIPSFPDQ